MELDRRSIERSDFATSRRGYDPQAVDAHLSDVAQAVEELKRTRVASAPMASSAAAKVQAVIEAAENSAADLERAAREEAERITTQARAKGDEQLELARTASARLVERVAELEREVDELAEGLRSSLSALGDAVRANVATLDAELVAARQDPESADRGAEVDERLVAEVEALAAPEPEVDEEPEPGEPEPLEREPEAQAPEEESAPAEAAPVTGPTPAPDGARVLALKMALDGSPREDTARYLRENFEVPEPDALLDEVYARAGR